jgi:hypothetical protein
LLDTNCRVYVPHIAQEISHAVRSLYCNRPVTAPAMSDIEFEDLIDSLSEASNYIDVKENDEGK